MLSEPPCSRSSRTTVAVVADEPLTVLGLRGLGTLPDFALQDDTCDLGEVPDVLLVTSPDIHSSLFERESLDRRTSQWETRTMPIALVRPRDLCEAGSLLRAGFAAVGIRQSEISEIAELIRAARRNPASGRRSALGLISPREQDVLALLARGHTNREIGQALSVRETTVRYHVRNMLQKFMVSRRCELVHQAVRRGLL